MNEIAEYERRISEALSRIAYGIETLQARPQALPDAPASDRVTWDTEVYGTEPLTEAAPVAHAYVERAPAATEPSEGGVDALQAELKAEREANFQLSERVRAIREKQEATEAALERKLGKATRLAEAATTEIARLKRANADLIALNGALTSAAGTVDPHLVNRSMQAELEALRAARAAEAQELAELILALEPLAAAAVGEIDPAAEQKEATDA
jgi:hypothetical protein